MQRLRRGFTLVELLVVIAIIAVLMAILLPSLSAAKAAANRVVCEQNMASVAKAMIGYANGNKGRLPETMATFGSGGSRPLRMNPTPGSGSPPWHALFDSGYLPNTNKAKLTYQIDPGLDTVRGGYYWNPHPGDDGDSSSGGGAPNPYTAGASSFTWSNAKARWTIITQIPSGRVLGCDVCDVPSYVGHQGLGRSKNAFFNLAYPDGSVKSIASPDVFDHITTKPILQNNATQGVSWQDFNDILRVLELQALGRNPRTGPPSGPGSDGTYLWPPVTPQRNQYYWTANRNTPLTEPN